MSWLAFLALSAAAVAGGLGVFLLRSMVRAAFSLLIASLAVAGLLLLLGSEFLFAVTMLVVIGQAVIMALFMVAFVTNPAGLDSTRMAHRPRFAALAGAGLFLLVAAIALTTEFPLATQRPPPDLTAAVGRELLGRSVLVFQGAGVTLLVAMIAVVVLAVRRGRFKNAIAVRPHRHHLH